MKNRYTAQSDSFFRALIIPNINIGFKQPNQPPKFVSHTIELLFRSSSYNGLDTIEKDVVISGVSVEEYIRRLNGLVLFNASDSDGISKYSGLDGDLLTMAGEISSPTYLGYVLFNVISKWVKEISLDIELISIEIGEN